MGSTWYGHQICSRDFTLDTGRNNYLLSIGWKGRVPVRMKEQKEININKMKNPSTHKVRVKLQDPAYNC